MAETQLEQEIIIDCWLVVIGERSERDTIRGVQIRAGAVCIYMYGGT